MRHRGLSWIVGTAIFASLAGPFAGLAQEQAQQPAKRHKHYTLVDMGTFGGPNSNFNWLTPVINDQGTAVGGADTADWDPICGCPVFHALRWREGVLTDLGTLPGGGNFSFGIAINNRGAIAGVSANGLIDPVTGIEAQVPTVWKNGHVTNLGTFGGSFGLAVWINERGQIVGGAENEVPDPFDFGSLGGLPSPTQWRATLWQNGTMQDLGTLGDGTEAFAGLINQRGQIAGLSFTDSVVNPATGYPTIHPFLWEDGHMTDLGTLGGAFAVPNWLNNRGQVVGASSTLGEQTNHAFLWTHGAMQDLGTLPGDYDFSEAFAINDSGEIAGRSTTADDQIRGFRWKHGVMTDLGKVGGYCCSNLGNINASGQIVGWAFNFDDAPSHAALWEKGRPGVDLNTLVPPGSGLELTEAEYINDRGEIAGVGLLPNGDAHAVLLIPKDGDDDAADDGTADVQSEAAPATQSASQVTHARLTPERRAELLARSANRHRFGFRPLKKAN